MVQSSGARSAFRAEWLASGLSGKISALGFSRKRCQVSGSGILLGVHCSG